VSQNSAPCSLPGKGKAAKEFFSRLVRRAPPAAIAPKSLQAQSCYVGSTSCLMNEIDEIISSLETIVLVFRYMVVVDEEICEPIFFSHRHRRLLDCLRLLS
jgi:hypothetical protein